MSPVLTASTPSLYDFFCAFKFVFSLPLVLLIFSSYLAFAFSVFFVALFKLLKLSSTVALRFLAFVVTVSPNEEPFVFKPEATSLKPSIL